MALNFDGRYTPDSTPADANYPYGSFKNETVPGALDGTPYEKDWGNDMLGFFQKLLNYANIVPSGNAETIVASQYFEALEKTFNKFIYFNDAGGGAANAIQVVSVGSKPPVYFDGQIVLFKASATNTGATTIQIDTLAIKDIIKNGGSPLTGGEIIASKYVLLRFNTTDDRFELVFDVPEALSRGEIDGLILSNTVADLLHDITIGVGCCKSRTDDLVMKFGAPFIKQIDAVWVEGNNSGGFPSGLGSVAANTCYHVFIVGKEDGSQFDAGFDVSIDATNLLADATDYTKIRRLGSVYTDGAGDIVQFLQWGDRFYYEDPPIEYNGNSSVAPTLLTVSTPLNVKTVALFNVFLGQGNGYGVYFSDPDIPAVGPSTTAAPLVSIGTGDDDQDGSQVNCLTNDSAQVRHESTTVDVLRVVTLGWIDKRGKDE